MDSARWSAIQQLFHAAVELPEPEQLDFLTSACGEDALLVDEVMAMLAADNQRASLLDRGLPDIANRIVGGSIGIVQSQEFGPYRLIKVLGEGGMGVVWLAERMDAGNLVAIKFLPHAGLSPARRERFALEIRTLAKLKHPYIARLYDAGTLDDGTPWFVMEYVEGVPILEFCHDPARTIVERLRLFRMVSEAVQYAHGQEIIHRDLKPSNIMVADDGTPRLLDFGIARELQQMDELQEQTKPGLRFMSPDYASPEWVKDGVIGLFTDVYSLGIILYQILTGNLPFKKSKGLSINTDPRALDNRLEKPSVAANRMPGLDQSHHPKAKLSKVAWSDLDVLCLKAMHQDAKLRYASVEALIRDIDHYLKNEPLEARPDSILYRGGKFFRRNRVAVLATSAALLLIAAMTVFFTVRLARTRDAALAEAARSRRIQQFMLNLLGASDQKAAPADNLRVVNLLDHGVREAGYLGDDPEAQSDLYENLGNMYDMLGEFSKAENLLLLALDRRKHAPRSDDAKTAEILVEIGIVKADVAQDPSQFQEAEHDVQQGLDLASAHFPAGDPRVLSAKAALGRVIAESGDSLRALALLQPIIQRQPNGGQADYALSDSLSTSIGAAYDASNIPLAETLTNRALVLDRRLFGPNHPQFALDLVDAALNYAAMARYPAAEPYYRQAIEIERAWYGPDHPDLANFEGLLARALHEEGKLAQSEDLLHSALKIQEKAYGDSDSRVAVTLDTLGEIQLDRGDLSGAEATFTQAVAIDQKEFGAGNFQTAIIAADLGETLLREKQFSRADSVLAGAVKTLLATLPPGAFNTATAQLSWGSTLLALKRYRDAEEQLTAAYAVYKAQDHPSPTDLERIRQELVTAYTALHEDDKAKRLRAEVASAANPNGSR